MLDKISLTDKECEYLAKGIAAGAGAGILLGAFTNYVALFFSLGGVLGIIGSLIYCSYKKYINKNSNKDI